MNEINVLDYNGLREISTSNLISRLFKYENDGDYPIWRSFLTKFFPSELANNIVHPIFFAERDQHIDISVTEKGKYAFIFENKLRGAEFQRNQLGRYFMAKSEYEPKNVYLVLLPGWIEDNFLIHIQESVWKAPSDWREKNDVRKCGDKNDRFKCWCDNGNIEDKEWCNHCIDIRDKFKDLDGHIKVIDRKFPEWLITAAREVVPPEEIYVRSAMIQFAHYIKGLYNIRLNEEEIMENIKVLKEELALDNDNPEESLDKVTKTLEAVNSLQQSLKSLQVICRVKIWQKEIENAFPNVRVDSEENNFGILINGIYCGVWIENDKPYWGFYRNPNKISNDGAEDMVNKIVTKANLKSKEQPTKNFIEWEWTEHGADRISQLLSAAKLLGFKIQSK